MIMSRVQRAAKYASSGSAFAQNQYLSIQRQPATNNTTQEGPQNDVTDDPITQQRWSHQ